MLRSLALALLLSLAAMAHAQDQDKTPADEKAYREASKIEDPEKQIAALRAVIAMDPATAIAHRARTAILGAVLKTWPQDQRRIHRTAKEILRAPNPTHADRAAELARLLYSAGADLPFAEKIAGRALKRLTLGAIAKQAYARSAADGQPAPSSAELQQEWEERRAALLDTLGQIQFKRNQFPQAERNLEQAHRLAPDRATTTLTLAKLAARRGDSKAAYDLALAAHLGGAIDKDRLIETGWAKAHGGSMTGFEEEMDSLYRQRYPNPVRVEPYQPDQSRTRRVVLAEIFTGSGCGPCTGVDVAMDALMERYGRQDLVVLMYHQHIPRPDPMTNADTIARAGHYKLRGVPSFAIDGKLEMGGGARKDVPEIYQLLDEKILARLKTASAARIDLEAEQNGTMIRVKAAVDSVKVETKDLKLYLVLAEREIRYAGENGIRFHPMVVRSLASFPVDAAKGATATWQVDLPALESALKKQLDEYEAKGHRGSPFTFREKKSSIDPRKLAVVAFVEDAKQKLTLQAAYVELKPGEAVALHQQAETAVYAATTQTAESATTQDPIGWTALSPSGRRVKLVATIAPGWHLYGLKQGEGGPIPTRIRVAPGQGWEQDGEVTAPEPISERDANFDMVVSYYLGEAAFLVPVRGPGTGEPVLEVHYQTCNDKLCLPPKTMRVKAGR